MPPLPIISSKQLIKILKDLGFELVMTKGSHYRFANEDGRKLHEAFSKKLFCSVISSEMKASAEMESRNL